MDATYLAWIDTRGAELKEPMKFFKETGVGLSDGKEFDGRGFIRLNFACPRSLLAEALDRMRWAMERRSGPF